MDMTWVTDRIAVGGGIWNELKMIEVAEAGVTHVINMQIEFDDRYLGIPHDIKILWNPTDDDFQFKPPELLQRGVDFALEALDEPNTKVFIHCAAGVHRAPMMTLAILLRTMDLMRIFDQIFILTQGGPGFATETVSLYIYRTAFRFFNFGYAAAMSFLGLGLTIVFARSLMRLMRVPRVSK